MRPCPAARGTDFVDVGVSRARGDPNFTERWSLTAWGQPDAAHHKRRVTPPPRRWPPTAPEQPRTSPTPTRHKHQATPPHRHRGLFEDSVCYAGHPELNWCACDPAQQAGHRVITIRIPTAGGGSQAAIRTDNNSLLPGRRIWHEHIANRGRFSRPGCAIIVACGSWSSFPGLKWPRCVTGPKRVTILLSVRSFVAIMSAAVNGA